MNIESINYAFDMSLFSLLSFVLIDHCDCLKVKRFNHVYYIMNCLSITNHCYACENCLVKQMMTLTMIHLRTSLMSNDLTRAKWNLILLNIANIKNHYLSWDNLVLPKSFTINGGYTFTHVFCILRKWLNLSYKFKAFETHQSFLAPLPGSFNTVGKIVGFNF